MNIIIIVRKYVLFKDKIYEFILYIDEKKISFKISELFDLVEDDEANKRYKKILTDQNIELKKII
jgi:hypothetical protein